MVEADVLACTKCCQAKKKCTPSWKPLEFASNALSMGLNSSLTNPNRAKDLIWKSRELWNTGQVQLQPPPSLSISLNHHYWHFLRSQWSMCPRHCTICLSPLNSLQQVSISNSACGNPPSNVNYRQQQILNNSSSSHHYSNLSARSGSEFGISNSKAVVLGYAIQSCLLVAASLSLILDAIDSTHGDSEIPPLSGISCKSNDSSSKDCSRISRWLKLLPFLKLLCKQSFKIWQFQWQSKCLGVWDLVLLFDSFQSILDSRQYQFQK